MQILNVMTIVLIILRALELITCSWVVCFIPTIAWVVIWIFILICAIVANA